MNKKKIITSSLVLGIPTLALATVLTNYSAIDTDSTTNTVPANSYSQALGTGNDVNDKSLAIGIDNIEARVLRLSRRVWDGLNAAGCEMMTPQNSAERAGNVCFAAENIGRITSALLNEGILIWGNYGGATRVRVSTHLYNDDHDVDRLLEVVQRVNLT